MKRSIVVPALAIVLAVLTTRSSAGPQAHAVLTGQDALVPTGVPWNLRFKVERDDSYRTDLKGVKVEFWANGALLGTATSGKDGYASFLLQTASTPGDLVVTGKLASGGNYTAPSDTLLVCVRDKAARLLVMDIDQTISAAPWATVTKKANTQLYPLPGAQQALTDIAHDATIVYLTAREDDYRAKTRDWLDHWSFPRGPVYCSDSDHDPSSAQSYKTKVLGSLAPYFTNIAGGVGNQPSDAYAYKSIGAPCAMLDTQTTSFPSFAYVAHSWADLRAANAHGKLSLLSWATLFH